jgi:hypothetical protein
MTRHLQQGSIPAIQVQSISVAAAALTELTRKILIAFETKRKLNDYRCLKIVI